MKKIDKYDLEAEREGNSIKRGFYIHRKTKRDIKRNVGRGNRIQQTRAEKRHVS